MGSLGAGGLKLGKVLTKRPFSLPKIQSKSSKSSVWKITPLRGAQC